MDSDSASSVDALPERYLSILDEYMALRASLGALQSATYHGLARANFSAERGMRYGPDHYDDRMQALRRLRISQAGEASDPGPAIFRLELELEPEHVPEPAEPEQSKPDQSKPGQSEPSQPDPEQRDEDAPSDRTEATEKEDEKTASHKLASVRPKDPLRWFGLLAPAALRQAQSQSVQAVEQVIPRLASLDAEMAHMEIRVRRARKRRTKAEAAAAKQSQDGETTREQVTV